MHQPTTPVRLELKYCERCGSLWLCQVGTNASYCTPCAREMAEVSYRGPRATREAAVAPDAPTDLDAAAAAHDVDTPPLGRCL